MNTNNSIEKIIKVEYKGIFYNIKIKNLVNEIEINCYQYNKIQLNQYDAKFSYNNLKKENNIFSIYENNTDICNLIINQLENGKFNIEKKGENMYLILNPIAYKLKEIIFPLKQKITNNEDIIPIILNIMLLTDKKYFEIHNNLTLYNEQIKAFKKENNILKITNYTLRKDIEKLKSQNFHNQKKIDSIIQTHKSNTEKFQNEITLLKRIIFLETLKKTTTIKEHRNIVYQISLFPNGRFASISADCCIKIFNTNYTLFLTIKDAHLNHIYTLLVIDDYNFITCSNDKSIKRWSFNEDKIYILEEIKNEAHSKGITKIIFFTTKDLKNYLISCSYDKTIKIWEKKNNTNEENTQNYIIKKILTGHKETIRSILQLNENILVSGGDDGIKTWDIKTFQKILSIQKCDCYSRNSLVKYSNKIIIVGGSNEKLSIVDVYLGIIINSIKSFSNIWSILVIENGLIITGSEDKDLRIFEINKNEISFLNDFKSVHNDTICCVTQIKNSIALGSGDGSISIWNVNSHLI